MLRCMMPDGSYTDVVVHTRENEMDSHLEMHLDERRESHENYCYQNSANERENGDSIIS
jgi:hypothetical protein